jgi:ribosome maturation factor RimP
MRLDGRVAAIEELVAPVLASLGLELFDVQFSGGGRARTLRITVDREGGVDLDTIAQASQAVSPVLDRAKELAGPYLLEVTSPGVERPLRRPEHFRRAIDETVAVKYRTSTGAQRVHGVLVASDDDTCTVVVDGEPLRIAFADVTDAHTVFEWGPAPRPTNRGNTRGSTKEKTRR